MEIASAAESREPNAAGETTHGGGSRRMAQSETLRSPSRTGLLCAIQPIAPLGNGATETRNQMDIATIFGLTLDSPPQ